MVTYHYTYMFHLLSDAKPSFDAITLSPTEARSMLVAPAVSRALLIPLARGADVSDGWEEMLDYDLDVAKPQVRPVTLYI